MKNVFPLLFLLFFSKLMIVQAQDIQNSGFENWTTIQYFEDPNGYTTTNYFTYFAGSEPNVIKTTDAVSGSFAIHMETVDTPDGIYEGAAFIGQPENDTFMGGIPYDERPDSLTGYAKFDVAATDTAYVAAIFKKFGAPIGVTFVQFYGEQGEYQYFSAPVEWLVPIISPDTMAIALISSSIFSEPMTGSSLTVDMVSLVGPGDPFPNGDFEDWIEFTSEEPGSWQSSNLFTMPVSDLSVIKSTNSHTGNYAAKIESHLTNFDDTLGFITNGYLGDEATEGGMPVDDIPEMLSGYYKYFPVGPDSATAGMTLYKYNTNTGQTMILDSAFIKLPAANEYTYFEIPVDYYSVPEPDTLNIVFGSGNFDDKNSYIGLGSTLYLDDLEITYKPHLVSVDDQSADEVPAVYPNPVSETLFFETFRELQREVSLKIFDINGHLVAEGVRQGMNKMSIQVDHLISGMYFYHLTLSSGEHQGKFIKK